MRRSSPLTALTIIAAFAGGAPAADPAGREAAAKALAARIDHHVEAGWKSNEVTPAPVALDATFLRRAYLDLAGKVPTLAEARDFIDDPDPAKRAKLVRRLLASDDYARHTATVWGRQLFPPNANNGFGPVPDPAGVEWLRKQVKEGAGQDTIVRALLAPPRPNDGNDPAARFVAANQGRPETVASAAGRLFLGVRVECAQCHHHPFAEWKREQFWALAAFFSALQQDGDPQRPRPRRPGREITIPETETLVSARFLGGAEPAFEDGADGRDVLAAWVTRRDNPYFARAAANRVWARYFGAGLIDPPDDMNPANPPSHPELLDELARAFADGGFDERLLAEAVLTSKAYQLSSAGADRSREDGRLFARAPVRGLSAEQVYDSLVEVTGKAPRGPRRTGFADPFGARGQFLARFSTPDRPAKAQTPVLQALHVMNGPLVAEATRPDKNRWLRVLAESAAERPERCVEELYLAVLIRPPTDAERERFVKYVREGGPHQDPKRAVADVFWVLLNSSEFVVNH